jgi:hypothetical protein
LLFETYRLDNLETDESQFLDGWSYFWAALGGPLYVLLRGFPKHAAIMLPISIVLAVTAAGLVIAVTGLVDQTMLNVIALIGIPAAALAVQSIIAIQLMRAAFIQRGWREGY